MSKVIGIIEAEVNLTEDPERVKIAIKNLFTPDSIELIAEEKRKMFIARFKGKEGLLTFYTILRQERILNAARRVLRKGIGSEGLTFCLNKQAAYVKRISFCEPIGESPLGPISVRIVSDEPGDLIDWLAPKMD